MSVSATAPSTTDASSGPTDVSRLLRFNSTPARLVVAFFVFTNTVFTVATIGEMRSPWPSLIAMMAVAAAAALLVRERPDPFPLAESLAVVGIVAASTALVSWELPTEGSLGRETWHFGANTWLLFFLTLRRRAWLAWLGFALMTAVTIAWAVTTGRGVGEAIGLIDTHAGVLLVATLFAASLRRTSRRINALNARSVDAAVSAAAADASQQIRRQRVSELASAVVPLLERIADGSVPTADERTEYRTAEATLRDTVRGRSLCVPAVVDATRAARARGVEVTLLDDRGLPLADGTAMRACIDTVVARVQGANMGSVTVRLLPEGRDSALTVVTRNGEATDRVTLDAAGAVVA